jgi:Recombination endonuclease VII
MSERRCITCKEVRPLSEFWLNRTRKAGYQTACKTCQSAYSTKNWKRWRERRRIWSKTAWSARKTARRCGVSKEAFHAQLIIQNYCCGICEVPLKLGPQFLPNRFALIDHDHATNEFRGVLCPGCNSGLGYLDKRGWLDKALNYKTVRLVSTVKG